jgi:hypothetical protein
MKLKQIIRDHDLRRVDGHEDYSRWVVLSAGYATPKMFGDLHRADDFSICGALPRECGMLWMLQRNEKPVKQRECAE